jgi:cytochrome P450
MASKWAALVAAMDDPFPVYEEFRREGPVLRGAPGQWLVLSHGAALQALRESGMSVDPRKAQRMFLAPAPGAEDAAHVSRVRRGGETSPRDRNFSLIRMDPPDHTRLRNNVSKVFTARAIQRFRPFVQETVDGILDRAASTREIDVVSEFAYPLSVTVIGHLLGVPVEDRHQVALWSEHMIRVLNLTGSPEGRLEAERRAVFDSRVYFERLVAQRRGDPQDDLLTSLVGLADERLLTEGEAISFAMLLVAAGHETTVDLISNSMLALTRHPEALARFAAEPDLAESAVEEFLRFDSPVQIVIRSVPEGCELAGVSIRRGSRLAIVLGAANRDPETFESPSILDIGRRENRHLAFGGGIHYCLGAGLARLEAQVALAAMVTRHPGLRPAGDGPKRRPNLVLRGLERFPIRL